MRHSDEDGAAGEPTVADAGETGATGPSGARSLSVAVVVSSLGVLRGGMENIARDVAAGLAARGHRVTVVAGRRGSDPLPADLAALDAAWIRVPCVPADHPWWRFVRARRPGWPLKAQSLSFVCAARLQRRAGAAIRQADVTLTVFEAESVLVSEWRQRSGKPNVWIFPGSIDARWTRRDRSAVRLAISHAIAARCAELPAFEVDDVVQPVAPTALLQAPRTIRPVAAELLFVGRLEENKGVLELMTLFEVLARTRPALRLRLLGDGPLRDTLMARAAAAGLQHRVDAPGGVPSDVVRQALGGADVFVFPSRFESFGLAVLEALAAGLPVVATDIDGLREVAGDAALWLPVGNPARWVGPVAALLDDATRRRALSEAGRGRARGFCAQHAAARIEGWLFAAVNRAGAAAAPAPGGARLSS